MTTQFQPTQNVPIGGYLPDGVRVGPDFTQKDLHNGDNGFYDASGNLIAFDYTTLGRGLLVSPNYTHNIVPYPSAVGNVVTATANLTPGWLVLSGDNIGCSTLLQSGGPNGAQTSLNVKFPHDTPYKTSYLQFDWPRVVQVRVATSVMAAPTNVTIFGEDFWGFPMQHTYVVNSIGTQPGPVSTFPIEGGDNQEAKAFYRVTGVYCNGTTGGGGTGTIALETTNVFGLPYKLSSWGDVVTFRWDGLDMTDQSNFIKFGTVPTALTGGSNRTPPIVNPCVLPVIDNGGNPYGQQNIVASLGTGTAAVANCGALSVFGINPWDPANPNTTPYFVLQCNTVNTTDFVQWTIPNGGKYLIFPGSSVTPTSSTGDVRGLVQLPFTGQTWNNPPDGTKRLIFQYYQRAFDQMMQLQAAGFQPQGYAPPFPSTTPDVIPYPTKEDAYGLTQYWSGVPA